MITDKASIIARIIIRVRTGKPTEHDRKILLAWLREERENRLLYKKIIRGESARDYFRSLKAGNDTLDVSRIAQQIRILINKAGEKNSRHILVRRIAWSASVAAVLVAVAVSVIFRIDRSIPERLESEQLLGIHTTPVIISGTETIELPLREDANFVRSEDFNEDIISESLSEETPSPLHLIIPDACTYAIVLSDGSKVTLNANSRLTCPSHFIGDTREVFIIGEAFFEITASEKPFIVNTDNGSVRVYGTKFNVNTREGGIIKTLLVEGKVGMRGAEGMELMLNRNQLGVIDAIRGTERVFDVDPDDYLAWMSGYIKCLNRTFDELINEISFWYGIDFKYDIEKFGDMKVNVSISCEMALEDTLDFIKTVTNVKFIKTSKGYDIIE